MGKQIQRLEKTKVNLLMGKEEKRAKLIEEIYRNSYAGNGLEGISAVLYKHFDAMIGCYGIHDLVDDTQSIRFSLFEQDIPLSHYEHYKGGSPLSKSLARKPVDNALADHAADTAEEYYSSAIFNELFKPHEIDHSLMVVLGRENGAVNYSGVRRGDDRGEFDDEEIQELNLLAPHLRQAWQIERQLGTTLQDIQILEQSLNSLSSGVLILDARKKARFINTAAERILAEKDGFALLSQGEFVSVDYHSNKMLQCLIEQAASPAGLLHSHTGGALSIPRASGKKAYGVLVTPLDGQSFEEVDPFSRSARTMVFIHDPETHAGNGAAHSIAAVFGFAPREADVAAALITGRNIPEIAEGIGLKESTTRFYVKQLLAKTGARSQHELVSMIFRSVPNL